MKLKLIASLLLIAAIQKTNAQSCQSLFSGAANIFNNVAKDFIEFRGQAAKVFVDFIIPKEPRWETELNKLIDGATNLQLQLYSSYGVIAGQGNGKIGDIDLIIPVKTFTGTCYTERTFTILQSPYDKVVITVKKTDGKRGLKMKACAKYSNGSIYDEQEREIGSGNETAGASKTFTFEKNMTDKSISLHLVASGALPTDKCEYRLSIEGYFNEDEMVALDNKNKKDKEATAKNANNAKLKEVNLGGQTNKTVQTGKQPVMTDQKINKELVNNENVQDTEVKGKNKNKNNGGNKNNNGNTEPVQPTSEEIKSPRDISTGQSTGKRQYKPATVVAKDSVKTKASSQAVDKPVGAKGKGKQAKSTN